MMLTRLIRRQLWVFAILAATSLLFVGVIYADLPRMVGLRGYTVTADFADVSGLYPRALVTYRGVDVGTVERIDLTEDGATVVLALEDSADVPASVQAQIHSTSAIGEQYVDLVPENEDGPALVDGDEIPRDRTVEMPQITPVLERLNTLLESVPKAETAALLDQVDEGLSGAGPELGGVVDQTTVLLDEAQAQLEATTSLVESAAPLLSTQQDLTGEVQASSQSLAEFTTTLASGDATVRALLEQGPVALGQITQQLTDVSPTLPVLLANLTTTGQVLTTYLPHLEQTLVVYPALLASLQSAINPREEEGDVQLDLKATLNNPQSCVAGYIDPEDRRVPADTSTTETDGEAHCEVADSDEEGVRGLRNLPCPGDNSQRGATPAECGLIFAGAADADGDAQVYVPYDPTTEQLTATDGIDYTIEPNQGGGGSWTRVLTDPLAALTP